MRALPFALVVVCALAFGVFGGLGRLGGLASWNLPPPVIGLHGPLMVLGFLGTVISLERAKALGRTWGYLAPALTAVGVVLLLAGNALAAPLVLVGQALLVVILAIFFARDRALYSAILLGAAVSLLAGSAFYLSGQPVSRAVFWWMSFLTLTIAGERLELGRLIRIGPVSRVIFLTLACLLPLGAVCASLVPPDAMGKMRGAYPFGAGLLGLSLWLSLKDVARRTIRFGGLPRFIATCLLSGNAWLGISGGLLLAYGGLGGGAGPVYDAILHALFVGFVFSMIFGHAPVILPALTGLVVPFHRYFYGPLALLHLSLALRLAGDFGGGAEMRYWGALLNGIAVLAFLLGTGVAVLRGRLASRLR